MTRLKDNTVIVVDASNYKDEYREKVPFKAVVVHKYESEIVVMSVVTSKMYELYYEQILESMEIEQIINMIDLTQYGTI